MLEDDTDVGTHRIPLTASGSEMSIVHGNCRTKQPCVVDTGQVQGVQSLNAVSRAMFALTIAPTARRNPCSPLR